MRVKSEKELRQSIKGWTGCMQALFILLFETCMSAELQSITACDAYAATLRDVADAIEHTFGSKAE